MPSEAVKQNWQSRAADLAGNANGRAGPPACPASFGGIASFAAVTRLAAVPFWHPYRLHALPVDENHEITDRAIAGSELFLDRWHPEKDPGLLQAMAKIGGQGGNLANGFDPLPVNSIKNLMTAV